MRKKQKEKDNEYALKNKAKKSFLSKCIIKLIFVLLVVFIVFFLKSVFKWQKIAKEMIKNEPSIILDISENEIAKFGNERKRKNVSISEIPERIKNAYVSIEDERYYRHFGIDIKRTAGAIFSYVKNFGSSSFGASTITQQLVKNLTGDDSASVSRKVKEWKKSIELEWCLNKDEILEAYLNIIYVGPNVYGVSSGAKYYFSKELNELTLAESAFLAGINIAPASFSPFSSEKDNSEKIKKRTKIVLNKMCELGYISEVELDTAILEVEDGLKFKKGEFAQNKNINSDHTDALLTEVITEIAKEKNISITFATNYLQMANLKIYSTQNTEIQSKMEKNFKNPKYILASEKDSFSTSQASMVIMDHKTGYVIGCVGRLGEKKENRGFNRAIQAVRQTGSSSKLIAVIAPALEEKIITPVTTYVDEPTTFLDENGEEYTPEDYNDYIGQITVRRAIESSQNIPFVKIMRELTPKKSVYYLRKMGITTLEEEDKNLALALGGENNGIPPLEMTAAYSTIANDGIYIEPTFFTKIENSSGKTILNTIQRKERVFSEAVCFVVKKLMTEPVQGKNGTANYCKIKGIEVAAKTGTTNENYDRWLCGFTNYYTGVTWFGFDFNETINFSGKNPAGLIWADVMKEIHKGLDNSNFEMTGGVECVEICEKSGMVANQKCTDKYTEYFLSGTVPINCVMHTN